MKLTALHRRAPQHTRARGVASLAVTMIMLALSALVVLYTNRGLLFEQRTSANQVRATTAFEVAEAGIEWATARLNDGTRILPSTTSNCLYSADANAREFKDIYTPSTSDVDNPLLIDFTPAANSRAACSIDDTANPVTTCNCPTPGTTPTLGAPGARSFSVLFENVPDDDGAVRVTSVGCLNNAALCLANNAGNSEATATISVVVKFVPGSGSLPNAALTAGGYVSVCGASDIQNLTTQTGGILINAGGQTQVGQSTYQSGPLPSGAQTCGGGGGQVMTTIPGTPLSAAIVPNDPPLAAAAQTSDSMFYAFFGMTIADYKAPPTCVITAAGSGIAANMLTAYNRTTNPCNRFWLEGDLQLSGNGTFGAPASGSYPGRQVIIASNHNIQINGTYDIYGILYSDSVDWNNLGTGNATIHGAVITRGNYYSNGNSLIDYDLSALTNLVQGTGQFVRVPGSWRDFTP